MCLMVTVNGSFEPKVEENLRQNLGSHETVRGPPAYPTNASVTLRPIYLIHVKNSEKSNSIQVFSIVKDSLSVRKQKNPDLLNQRWHCTRTLKLN